MEEGHGIDRLKHADITYHDNVIWNGLEFHK